MKLPAIFSGHTKAQEDAFKELAQTLNFSTVAKLYSNPYFTRLWIIQEIALAQKAVLMVESRSITYDDFAMATAVLYGLLHTFSTNYGPLDIKILSSAWNIVTIKLAYTRKQNRHILTDAELEAVHDDLWRPDSASLRLLDFMHTIDSECSDPRDQIYGLLSLKNDDIDLNADYSKSTFEVYADFAKAYLAQRHIRILNLAGLQRNIQNLTSNSPLQAHTSASPSCDTIPSWAPDWRVRKPYMALGGSNRPGFTAGFSLPKHVETIPRNLTKIIISGVQIDTVAHIRHHVQLDAAHFDLPLRFETHEPTRASIAALSAFCVSHYQNAGMTEYATGEDILTAFVRTVLANGVYATFGRLLPVMKESPDRMVLLWRVFETLKIKPDDTIDLALNMNLPNMQTGEQGQSRAQSVRTAYLIILIIVTALRNRAVLITLQGYLGVGPALTKVGDSIVIFGGSQTPFVMRKIGSSGGDDRVEKDFCILGDCYLHGFMYGELLTEAHRAALEMFGIV